MPEADKVLELVPQLDLRAKVVVLVIVHDDVVRVVLVQCCDVPTRPARASVLEGVVDGALAL